MQPLPNQKGDRNSAKLYVMLVKNGQRSLNTAIDARQ